MIYDRNRARLTATDDELKTLVGLASGSLDPSQCDDEWRDAGIVVDDGVHPVPAGMARVALDPDRATSIRRFDGANIAPLFVGLERTGRATMTEAATTSAAPDTTVSITATRLELLPALICQAVRLQVGYPAPVGRSAVDATAAEVADTLERMEAGTTPGDDPAAPTDIDGIATLLTSFEHGWQAAGGWRGHEADTFVTVFDAGLQGLWFVETEGAAAGEALDRSKPVRLEPCTVADVTARLGDVVTGRRTAQPRTVPGSS